MIRSKTFKIAHDHFDNFLQSFHSHYKQYINLANFKSYILTKVVLENQDYVISYKDLVYYLASDCALIISLPVRDREKEIYDILEIKFLNLQEFLSVVEIYVPAYNILGINTFRAREDTISELANSFPLFTHTPYLSLESILNYPDLFKYSISSKDLSRSWFITTFSKKSHMYSPSIDYTKKAIVPSTPIEGKANFDILQRNLSLGVQSLTNIILENKNYTFGLEIETSEGLLNEKDYDDLNVVCVYDGSLKAPDGIAYGGEYVTGVLKGDAGINQVRRLVNVLIANNCKVNNLCSIHLHIGSANFNKENLLAMYKLGIMLEDELFSMMPLSRRSNVYCTKLEKIFTASDEKLLFESYTNNGKNEWGISQKDLQQKTIDYLFDLRLFNYVKYGKTFRTSIKSVPENQSKPTKSFNKLGAHPHGNKCGYDKNAQRYSWLNFVTCLFNNKGVNAKTLEFRLHSGTLNFKKILSWLKICIAFTWFAENHQDAIFRGYYIDKNGDKFSIDLSLILKLCYPNSHQLLIDYVKERIGIFNSIQAQDAEVLEYQESLNLVKSFKLKELITLSK